MSARVLFFASVGLFAACGGAPREAAAPVRGAAPRVVAWNPTHASVGNVRAVAEDGDVLAVFADDGVTVFRGGAPIAHDAAAHDWVDATTVFSPGNATHAIVGIDRKGRIFGLRALSKLEDVTDRYGVGAASVRGAAMVAGSGGARPLVGFALDRGFALADGTKLTRYAGDSFSSFAGGGTYAAGIAGDSVVLVDSGKSTQQSFPLAGARFVALTDAGDLFAATASAVYTKKGDALVLAYEAPTPSIHGLVASGANVWIADGTSLDAIENGRLVVLQTDAIAPNATLASSPSGDVWVFAKGSLDRFSRSGSASSAAVRPGDWSASIAPVFARSCAACHLPGGVSGTDLSTADAWKAEKKAISARVLESRTMPPAGHPLDDADRAAIRAWVEASP